MKKSSLFLIGLLLLSFYASAQKVSPQLNLVKGATYSTISKNVSRINQTINGQPMEINMVINGKISFNVAGIRDSLYDMQVKYDSLSLHMNLPTGEMTFSSERGTDPFSVIMAKIKLRSFTVVISKKGRIISVAGIEPLITEIINGIPDVNGQQKTQAMNQMKQSFGENAFKGSFEMFTYIFPTNKVAKNDKWIVDTELQSTLSAKLHTVYALTDITADSYVINGISTVSTDEKSSGSELNGMPVKYNVAGTMNSSIKADKKTGWITSAHINQSIKGNIEIKDNPKLPGGMLIPLEVNTTATISDK